MFPVIEYIKTCLNGLRSRIEKVEKSISQALASVKAQFADIIQDIKKESSEAIKSSTADWGQNDSNALDYVKNRTHYMLPATPIGSLEFTATSSDTIEYTLTNSEEEYAIFAYFQSLSDKGEVMKVVVGGKDGLLAVTFDHSHFDFSGVFKGGVVWSSGKVLSLVAQNDFITFNQGDTYTASFGDTTKPYYSKLDFNYMPDNVYSSENAPVKFGAGENSAVQGSETTATGYNAHAEGYRSKATGNDAHAEGVRTQASGFGSHAEGDVTEANGNYSHAEGEYTVANRSGMHVEGKYNLYDSAKYVDVVTSSRENFWSRMYAASEYTFDADTGYYTLVNASLKNEAVIGLYYATSGQYKNGTITILKKPISLISGTNYNIERHNSNLAASLQGKYVHVVGNGVGSARSNAYTLDWDGNGWFAGNVFVGGKSQDEGVKLLKTGEAIPIPQTASVGQVLAVKAVDETGKPTEWEPVEIPSGGGGGISATARNLLITILRNGVYSSDQSSNITELEKALGGTVIVYYTITNNLTNVTNSNSAGSIQEKTAYIASLAAVDGYAIDSVSITMGGVDVTTDVYTDGIINISSVTGDVEIVASATAVSTEPVLNTDGLVFDYDFRNARMESYNLSGWGNVYRTIDKTGTGLLFGLKESTGDDVGLADYNFFEHRLVSSETQKLTLGSSYTAQFLYRSQTLGGTRAQPDMLSWAYNTNFANKIYLKPKYLVDTTETTVTDTAEVDIDVADYAVITYVVDGTKLTVYYNNSIIYDLDGSNYDGFTKWVDYGVPDTIYNTGYEVSFVGYNRALSEVEIVDNIEYFKTLEVTA